MLVVVAFAAASVALVLSVLAIVWGTNMPDIETLRTAALGATALGQTAFVLLYCSFPWYRRFLGRALFFKALALTLIVDAYMVYRVWSFSYADEFFTTLYILLALGVWAQFGAFLRVKLSHRENQS